MSCGPNYYLINFKCKKIKWEELLHSNFCGKFGIVVFLYLIQKEYERYVNLNFSLFRKRKVEYF